jgi:hypothetical protein
MKINLQKYGAIIFLLMISTFILNAQTQVGLDIDGELEGDQSGKSVAMSSDGSRVAIGAINNDGSGSNVGHIRIYEYSSGSWSQLGADIDGEAAYDEFGWAVSMSADGSRVIIGAKSNDGVGNNGGHARIYEYGSGSWVQLGTDIDGEVGRESIWLVGINLS